MSDGTVSIKSGRVCWCCALLVLCLAASSLAGGLEEARRRGRLLVGVRTDLPPFGFLDATGQVQGFDADLARRLGHALAEGETALELVPVSSGGRIPLLYSELIDVIIAAMTITEDRQRVLDFSSPYFLSASLVLTRRESAIQGMQDLAGTQVAVVEGAVQQRDLPLIAPAARLVAFPRLADALAALQDGRVDALCQDEVVVAGEARRNTGLRTAGTPFLPRSYAMAVRKGDQKLLRWLNAQLEKMEHDGTLPQLRRKHFGEMADRLPSP